MHAYLRLRMAALKSLVRLSFLNLDGPSCRPCPWHNEQGAGGTPLQTGFSFWYMRRGKGANKEATASSDAQPDKESDKDTPQQVPNPYENSIKTVATIKTVEDFWCIYDFLVRPNDLPTTTDYHFFREGIKPTWEDANNSKGGKWIVRLRKGLASRYWEEILLAIIGGQFPGIPDGEICGAVVSIRYSEDIVSVWNRTSSDRDITERLRDCIKKILQLPPQVHMEYKPHQASLQDKSSFRNTQVWKPKSVMDRERVGDRESGIRRTGSWGERDELRGKPSRRETDRAWR